MPERQEWSFQYKQVPVPDFNIPVFFAIRTIENGQYSFEIYRQN